MASIWENIHTLLYYVVMICAMLMEIAGIIVLMKSSYKAFMGWIKKSRNIRLELGEGIALALEFKMGGEALRTVVVREWEELAILGAIIALRAGLARLIHWEIKEEKRQAE